MKIATKSHRSALCVLSAFLMIFSTISCTKTNNPETLTPPYIAFKTGPGYTNSDATVARKSSPLVGIIAYKSSSSDILTALQVYCSYNGKPDSLLYIENIFGVSSDNYGKSYPVPILDEAGTEKYTFTIVTASGLKSSLSVNFNVN